MAGVRRSKGGLVLKGTSTVRSKQDGIQIVGGEQELLDLIGELGDLGEPKWVLSRYGAAMKEAMKPVLALAKSLAPVGTGNLANSLTITSKKSKRANNTTEARVGVDADKFFLKRDKNSATGFSTEVEIQPMRYVASVEFGNKKGMSPRPFLTPAYDATGRREHILPRINDFMKKAIKKRTKFLKKGVK